MMNYTDREKLKTLNDFNFYLLCSCADNKQLGLK